MIGNNVKKLQRLAGFKANPSFATFQMLEEMSDKLNQKLVPDGVGLVTLKGDPGKDADEQKIIDAVLKELPAIVDSMVPDEESIASRIFAKLPRIVQSLIPIQEKIEVVDPREQEKKIVAAVLKKIKIPEGINEKVLIEKILSQVPRRDEIQKMVDAVAASFVIPKGADIARLLEALSGHDRLDYNALKNRPGVSTYGKGGSKHGGGDTIVAGTNITITVNSNGTKTISSTGGSGSGYQTATGTVNGVNTVFTFATAPSVIVVDGQIFRKTQSDGVVHWTGTTTITLQIIVPFYDIFAVA